MCVISLNFLPAHFSKNLSFSVIVVVVLSLLSTAVASMLFPVVLVRYFSFVFVSFSQPVIYSNSKQLSEIVTSWRHKCTLVCSETGSVFVVSSLFFLSFFFF